ncbi:sugar transferase [Phaeobacter sp.]|uniref:sugar transferase n=1 Tax=Phaeobacter sp. TaxID=1902409 RepID=UPI0025FAD6BE|nr:sugar transferase [Phaeobacter sp.]
MSDIADPQTIGHSVVNGHSEPALGSAYATFGKRALDIALAIALLPMIAPVIAVLWLLARKDGGSGFYGHRRIGRDGTPFTCWKIRTMICNAEEILEAHLASNPTAAEEWAQSRKLTHDPRITSFGNFLRRSSLDELPQIWSVLRGHMSFVGPRPIVRCELPKYGVHAGAYLGQRPGITGLWQVSGRNDVSYAERVQFDVTYARKCGLIYDLKLMLLTGRAVVNKTGR